MKDIRLISRLLNGVTPKGEKLDSSIDFRSQRYMILLYVASKFPIFEEYMKGDEKKNGFTLYSLKKISKFLELEFDRTKSSRFVYDQQYRKGRVKKSTISNVTIYNLTGKGILHCKKCIKLFLELHEPMTDRKAVEPFTHKASKELERAISRLQKMTPKQQEEWLRKHPDTLFDQPTKKEHVISQLLRKIEML